MAKKNIKTVLKTRENETVSNCSALMINNRIQYLESGFKMVIDFQEDYVTMIRKNDEYEIFFQFKKESSKGKITLATGESIPIEVSLKKLEVKEKSIFISYLLNDEEYEYSIAY